MLYGSVGRVGLRSSVAPFSPAQLFVAGEQGAWYDPSDFSTMFQDAAGTTPVTAVEQPVGLILDKSKSLTLGSELVTNGTFDTNLNGWTNNGTVIASWTANGASVTRNASGDLIYQAVSCTVGRTYLVSAEVKSGTLARIGFNSAIVGGVGEITLAGGVGVYTGRVVATATTMYVLLGLAANAQTAVFDNVTVKELAGNHASQTTSTSRPVLSARVNLLMYSEQFDNAYWNKTASSIIANATTAPDGATTADKLVESATLDWHGFYKAFTAASGQTWSICLKAGERTYAQILDPTDGRLGLIAVNLSSGTVTQNTSSIPLSVSTLGNGWYRVSVTLPALCISAGATTLNTSTASSIYGSQYTGDGTSGIYIWGADLRATNTGVNLPPYQRIASSTDYDTTGFPYYLAFDGTDDFLVTGTINPGSVDKAQVFAGVRKLSDVAVGVICELSANTSTNNGAFFVAGPATVGSNYGVSSRGTASANQTVAGYAAPLTNVLGFIGDISGDVSALRVNGAQVGINTADQGTGNYGSYAMYIGRRGGTTLPFNGRLYGLIVRFSAANLPDATITNAETWMNTKTGAY